MKSFEFKCSCCGEIHKGMPHLGSEAPIYYYGIPDDQKEENCFLTSDTCVLNNQDFFIKGCLEIPIMGYDDYFSFGAWMSLSERNFSEFENRLDEKQRSHYPPMVGWFSSWLWPYEETEKLKARIHFRDDGIRPLIELEPTEHPLAIAQRNGMDSEKLIDIYEYYVHGKK